MFEIGDYVLRYSAGVWHVCDISSDGYVLSDIESGNIVNVTIKSNDIIRKIITKDALLDILERIPYIRTLQAPNDKIRKEYYDESMAENDEIEWIKVIKTIYMRRQEKRLLPYEIEYDIQSKKYFHGEIAVILDLKYDEVEKYIKTFVADIW